MESEEELTPIYHGCPAVVWSSPWEDESRNCKIRPGDGDKLCPVHRRQFTRNPGAEAFQDLTPGIRDLLIALDNGTQVRLFPSRKKANRIRSWTFQLQLQLERQEEWELNSFTASFNQSYSLSFSSRQVSQGLKILVDRATAKRFRKLCKGDRLTLYSSLL